MSKTLGQIYGDAIEEQKQQTAAKTWGDRHAAGIAAVARHVVAEAIAAHVAECHSPAKHDASDVFGPVKTRAAKTEPPQPEAGDWMSAAVAEFRSRVFAWEDLIRDCREAAERHYADQAKVTDRLLQERNLAMRELSAAEKERDAALAECERLRSELATVDATLGNCLSFDGLTREQKISKAMKVAAVNDPRDLT